MKLEIIEFMNSHTDWEELLAEPPYCIKTKRDGEYILLEYNHLASDFNLSIVRECRGIIITYRDGAYKAVAVPFFKFGNAGEAYVPEIDWQSAVVYEKIDGSLMKMWYDRGEWHLSTNGTIDAFKAPLGDFGISFGDYFLDAFRSMIPMLREDVNIDPWEYLINQLNKSHTYMFELVGPKNRVVIGYEKPLIYLLGARSIYTHYEARPEQLCERLFFAKLKTYALPSLEKCIARVEKMSRDEEGFVVCDKNFNRAKIKSPEYLLAAQLHNNGVITRRRLLQIIWDGKLDDFVSYCPQYEAEAEVMLDKYLDFYNRLYCLKKQFAQYKSLNRQEYWELAKKYGYYSDFIMKIYVNDLSVDDYLSRQVELRGIDWLLERIDPIE